MFTTDGVALRADSANVRSRLDSTAASVVGADCCIRTTLPARCVIRGSKSGRSVATTKSAAKQSVQACAKSNQNLRNTIGGFLEPRIIGSDARVRSQKHPIGTPSFHGLVLATA